MGVTVEGSTTPTDFLTVVKNNSGGGPLQDKRFLVDQAGNVCITVHRTGKQRDNGPDILPMEENVQRIIAIFNGAEA